MGWIKERREARRVKAAQFGVAWLASIKVLDELAELYAETTDTSRKRNILCEYARYGTECWVAIVSHRVPAALPLDFDTETPRAYFPSGFPSMMVVGQWADSKRIDRQDTVGVISAHAALTRDARRYALTDEPGEYFQHLETYAGLAHLTLKRVLPV